MKSQSNEIRYDVFLSHNSADTPAVEAIATQLQNDAAQGLASYTLAQSKGHRLLVWTASSL